MASLDKLVEQAKSHLDEGESVLLAIDGQYEVERFGADSIRSGVLIATERRLVFYAKKLTGYDLESFPYKTLSSFERGKNMMGGTLKFHSSGNTVSMKWIKASNLDDFVTVVRENMNAAQSTSAPQSGVAADPMDQLKKLGEHRH